MRFVQVGNYTINLDNVTEVVDYGETGVAVCFLAAWPNPDPYGAHATHIASRNLTGEDADAMRRYIARIADDAMAQVR